MVAGASATLLSVEKGPCEFCHQVIPLAQLIQHEVNKQKPLHYPKLLSLLFIIFLQATCRYIRPKPSLAPPTSSQYSPAPPPSSPTLLQENSSSTAGATLTAGKRGLAIKFPGKEDQSDTTAHQEGDTIRRLDPVVKPASLAANDSPSPFLSSSSGKGKEFKGSKKRQSPSETFEPWLGVREPVKKVPRTEVDGGSVDSSSSTIISRSSVTAKSVAGGASGSKSKPVYAGASGRDVYGADSIERGGNVLSSAARGVPSSAIKQVVRESRSKTDTTVKSVNRGMKELSLHSKSDAESKSLSTTAAKAKPTSVTSSRNPPSKTKSLQTGNSKLQISGTKVSGTSSIPHSNATRTPTGTTGTKSVGNYSKEHSTASKKPLGVSSLGLGSSGTTKQTVGASTSARGRGRGRGQAVGTASRQSSIGGGGGGSNSVSKGIGRGRGGAGTSPSTRHRTNSSGKDNAQTKSYPQHSRH